MSDRAALPLLGLAIGVGAWLLMRSQDAAAARQLWQQNFAPFAPYDPLASVSRTQLEAEFGAYAAFLERIVSSSPGADGDASSSGGVATTPDGESFWWDAPTPWELDDWEASGGTFTPIDGGSSPWTPWDSDDAAAGAFTVDPWDKSGGGYVQPVVFLLKPGESWRVGLYPEFASTIAEYAAAYGVPLDTFEKLLYQESRYREDIIYGATQSSAGAAGIAQFMPGTARQYGLILDDGTDLRGDPVLSIEAAARYLAALYRMFGNWPHAVAAYNTGPGNMRKYLRGEKSLPGETMKYVAAIFGPGTTLTA